MNKPFQAYKGNDHYVFVCYAHADETIVYSDIEWLNQQGLNLWYDEGISVGHVWRAEIAEAILGASRFLFFISAASLESEHCLREVEFAIDKGVDVIPVYLDDSMLPRELELVLGRIQAIYRKNNSNYRQYLLAAQDSSQPQSQFRSSKNRKSTNQLKKLWAELPSHWKLIFVLLIFFQVASIASIADRVYEFRGFILTGIEFYRVITSPIVDIAQYLGLTFLTREALDYLTWLLLFLGAEWRALFVLKTVPQGVEPKLALLLGLALAFLSAEAFMAAASSMYSISSGAGGAVRFVDIIIIVLAIIGLVWGWGKGKQSVGPTWTQSMVLAAVFFIVPIIIFSFLAGISEGLLR